MFSVLYDTRIKLRSSLATGGEIDESLHAIVRKKNELESIVLDMSEVNYITTPSMISLIAITNGLLKKNVEVKYSLPSEKKIRDILRIWRFPESLKDITGRSFSSLVMPEDIKYFGESREPGDYFYWLARKDKGLSELIKRNFFAITSIPFEKKSQRFNAVDTQHNKWNDEVVKSILKRHLEKYDNDNKNLLPSRIIIECVTNAVRHGGATNLLTGSYFDEKSKFLTITYWDNGLSVYETLNNTLSEQGTIRYLGKSDNNDYNPHFSLDAKIESDSGKKYKYYHSSDEPSKSWDSTDIFISSLFPGITSDIYKESFEPNKYIPEDERYLKNPGMGFPTLLNAVIDLLNGSIAIRCGDKFMNLSKPPDKRYALYKSDPNNYRHEKLYKIKIKEFNQNIYPFLGNMITIRLPLKKT